MWETYWSWNQSAWWLRRTDLRCCGHVDYVKWCIMLEFEGTRRRGQLRKSWCSCVKGDIKSFGLSGSDASDGNQWRVRIKGELANRFTWGNDACFFCVCLGMRHPVTNTVSRTIRVLNMLLTITAKSSKWSVTVQTLCAQSSVATQLRWGGIFNDHIIANFSQSVPAEIFLNRSVFSKDMDKSLVARFFGLTVYVKFNGGTTTAVVLWAFRILLLVILFIQFNIGILLLQLTRIFREFNMQFLTGDISYQCSVFSTIEETVLASYSNAN